jgi:hypothetical protein
MNVFVVSMLAMDHEQSVSKPPTYDKIAPKTDEIPFEFHNCSDPVQSHNQPIFEYIFLQLQDQT